jgi:prepilin-type N-terminal cleavage/methylation domain-containing protein
MVPKLTVQKTFARFSRRTKAPQSGFSLIEVMISMVVLTVGLVSLLGVFGLAMASTQTSQQDMIAKQLADEEYESIVTARNTTQINWDQINNVGSPNCPVSGASSCGIFLVGAQPLYAAGADGIYGTADDVTSGLRQTLVDPGADGIFGTADDISLPLIGYQRTIAISALLDPDGAVITSIRNVTITIQYSTPQSQQKSYIVNSYISQFN